MIVGIAILAALVAAAIWAWPKASTPECVAEVTEVVVWCVYADGSVKDISATTNVVEYL